MSSKFLFVVKNRLYFLGSFLDMKRSYSSGSLDGVLRYTGGRGYGDISLEDFKRVDSVNVKALLPEEYFL